MTPEDLRECVAADVKVRETVGRGKVPSVVRRHFARVIGFLQLLALDLAGIEAADLVGPDVHDAVGVGFGRDFPALVLLVGVMLGDVAVQKQDLGNAVDILCFQAAFVVPRLRHEIHRRIAIQIAGVADDVLPPVQDVAITHHSPPDRWQPTAVARFVPPAWSRAASRRRRGSE